MDLKVMSFKKNCFSSSRFYSVVILMKILEKSKH